MRAMKFAAYRGCLGDVGSQERVEAPLVAPARLQRASRHIAVAVALLCCFVFAGILGPLFSAAPAYADDFALVETAPTSNAKAAPVKGTYWLRFTNNVGAVEDNVKYVSLRTKSGKKVSSSKYTVKLPNVQRDFEHRQYIFIKVKGLDFGKEYRIRLEGELASKNGSTLEQGLEIPFTTVAKGKKAAKLAKPVAVAGGSGGGGGNGSGGQASQQGAASGGNSAVNEGSEQQTTPVAEQQTTPVPAGAIAAGVVAAIAVIVALVFDAKRRNRNSHRR